MAILREIANEQIIVRIISELCKNTVKRISFCENVDPSLITIP